MDLGGFSIWGGSPSGGVLHLGGFSIRGGFSRRVLHPGGFSIQGGSPSRGGSPSGGFSIQGGFSILGGSPSGGSPSRGVGGSPSGGSPSGGSSIQGGLHPGGVPCDISHHAFDVACMLPPHQLRHINSAPAYILLPGHVTCKACWDTHPPPPPLWTDTHL